MTTTRLYHLAKTAFVAAAVSLVVGACSDGGSESAVRAEATDPVTADVRCELGRSEAEKYGTIRAVRAEASTAAKVAEWQERRHGPDGPSVESDFRQMDSDASVFVCVYQGDFEGAFGPSQDGPGQGPARQFDRVTLLIDNDGNITLDSLTLSEQVRYETPEDYHAER